MARSHVSSLALAVIILLSDQNPFAEAACVAHGKALDCDEDERELSASVNLLQTKMTVTHATPSSASTKEHGIDDEPTEQDEEEHIANEQNEEDIAAVEDGSGGMPFCPEGREFCAGVGDDHALKHNDDAHWCNNGAPGPKKGTNEPNQCCPIGFEYIVNKADCKRAVDEWNKGVAAKDPKFLDPVRGHKPWGQDWQGHIVFHDRLPPAAARSPGPACIMRRGGRQIDTYFNPNGPSTKMYGTDRVICQKADMKKPAAPQPAAPQPKPTTEPAPPAAGNPNSANYKAGYAKGMEDGFKKGYETSEAEFEEDEDDDDDDEDDDWEDDDDDDDDDDVVEEPVAPRKGRR
eukprot:gnl/TRDRNA2_/TRDRNA2_155924_c1_seq5.p1 gnl/TRDRNA2_/TRDRNA2_155924_c1~~gnl/TRDRNA2_/TRDRNA2_155924_c1_seq5.p1  ORF type:complete len:347 (+),score=81.83 gnl/TRDRNA2_/TRDRNA2_155924_c1_seq5:171-1211(+)